MSNPNVRAANTSNRLGGVVRREGGIKVRLIKMFGLAALAAVVAMAFVGASSAMAEEDTVICLEDSESLKCPEEQEVEHVHFSTLEGTPGLLLSSVNVLCKEVLFLGLPLELGKPLVVHGHFTYTGCHTFSGSGCTVTEVSTDALLLILKLALEEAEVAGHGEVLVECAGLHCVYKGEGLAGEAQGSLGSGATVIEEQEVKKVSGLLCPKTSKLDISTGSLTELFVRN